MNEPQHITKIHKVLCLNLMEDGTTCLDVEAEVNGVCQIVHLPGGSLSLKEAQQVRTGVLPELSIVPPHTDDEA